MHELRFYAGVHALEGRTATFYLMSTGVNRNGWRVTDEALEQAPPVNDLAQRGLDDHVI